MESKDDSDISDDEIEEKLPRVRPNISKRLSEQKDLDKLEYKDSEDEDEDEDDESKIAESKASDEVFFYSSSPNDFEEDIEEVDKEFEALLRKPNEGVVKAPATPRALRILEGLKINWMNMRDGKTGKMLWESGPWNREMFESESEAIIPSLLLHCTMVSREINFSSLSSLTSFRLEQKVYFRGMCIEALTFQFGFVIAGSTNTWQQLIEAAPADDMYTAEEMSGKVVIETSFYDGDLFICRNLFRIFYTTTSS